MWMILGMYVQIGALCCLYPQGIRRYGYVRMCAIFPKTFLSPGSCKQLVARAAVPHLAAAAGGIRASVFLAQGLASNSMHPQLLDGSEAFLATIARAEYLATFFYRYVLGVVLCVLIMIK